MKSVLPRAFLLVLALTGTCAAIADTVRLAGSTTMINLLINPNRAGVESSTGHTLEVAGNGSGRGLLSLIEGKADAAMISDSLDVAGGSLDDAGKKVDLSKLRTHEMRKAEIVFIANASNPIGKLTFAQLSDIHTGKVTNWKQLGGSDKAITVYLEPVTGGVRSSVKKFVMGGAEYVDGVKSLTNIARVADLVAGDEAGIGAISKAFVKNDGKTRILETPRIDQPLAFVTLGEPTGKVKQVIDAYKTALGVK